MCGSVSIIYALRSQVYFNSYLRGVFLGRRPLINVSKLVLFVSENCPKCPRAKKLVGKLCEELGLSFETLSVEEEENFLKALQLNVAATPSLVWGEEIIFVAEVPSERELRETLKRLK